MLEPIIQCALLLMACVLPMVYGKQSWKDTKFLFTFGDSYTTTGYNISAGVDSPVPNHTSSNGPNWVQFLGERYNITNTKVFNLASGGATVDAALVPPYLPTVLSIVDQVSQFKTILGSKPTGTEWSSNNSLFAVWIGLNDIGQSFGWTNITNTNAFYGTITQRLSNQLDILYSTGARSFLLLTAPPAHRAPLFIQQGHAAVQRMKPRVSQYNHQLSQMLTRFQRTHPDLEQVTLFDVVPVFDTLLDDADTFGFVNATGWCGAYENGVSGSTAQIAPCAPVSSYFWLNSLHPLWVVHEFLAHAISTVISV